MPRKKSQNLMWLAVLALLDERPMHPYEIATLMKKRGISYSIKLNFGTLYATIVTLLAEGYISIKETSREGNLPERTVYQLTPAGTDFCRSFLQDILQNPAKEYPRFAAGLSFVTHLAPFEVAALLSERVSKLQRRMDLELAEFEVARSEGVNDLFLIETTYSLAMAEAELAWIKSLQADISNRKLVVRTGKD